MNPLDKAELNNLSKIIDKELPLYSENKLKIPYSYQQLPKNPLEVGARKDELFLNKYGHVFEEINHRDKKNPLVNWFKHYQIINFGKHGILKGDTYFPRDGFRKHLSPNYTEVREIGSLPWSGGMLGFGGIPVNRTSGSDIEIATGAASSSSITPENLLIMSDQASNTTGVWYDRIAYKSRTGSTNMRLGVYSDSGSTEPVNLLAETGSCAISSPTYTWQSVTEFELTTAKVWFAFVIDAGTFGGYYTITSANRRYKALTYGAMTNPSGSPTGYTSDAYIDTSKIGHS